MIVRMGRTRYPEAWDHCAFVETVLGALDRSAGAAETELPPLAAGGRPER